MSAAGTHGGVNRRQFIRASGSATLAAAFGGLARPARAAAAARPPNLLFVITDQQHIDSIAATGCAHIRTPALDGLVRRGVCFTQSYSTNPVCSPARSSMFTGRPTSETGVYKNGLPIRSGMPNLGQWLSQESQYETVYAGKWHVPRTHSLSIPGFRVLNTGIGGQGNIGDASTSRACEAYLRNRSATRPFLMVASFLQPHDICEWLRLNCTRMDRLPFPELAQELPPLPPNFGFDEREPEPVRSRRAGNEGVANGWTEEQWRYYIWSYYRHVEMVDAEVGRVLQAVDDCGYARDTVVIFTADHGEGTGHHQMTRKNSLYDESARVPLILSGPGRMPKGQVDAAHVVSGLDILPTVCDYAGVKLPPDVRGRSLRPLVEGRTGEWRPACVSEVLNNSGRMVRTDRFKYVAYRDDPVEQLFDMVEDPGETKNLAPDAKHADTLAAHRDALRDWETRLDVAGNVPHADAWRRG